MAGPFPCDNTPSQCETNPNPATNFSSESEDSTTFIGLAWNGQPPALNKPFNVFPCEAIAESQVSQSDADRIATNQVVACANPCSPTFTNTAQTATGVCGNGSTYSLTIPAGIFTADNQVLADRKAFTAASSALRGHSICLGNLAPSFVCKGEFYFGIISVVNTDAPATLTHLSGDLPPGLTMTLESDRAVIQGTPEAFGNAMFTLKATSAVGVVTQQTYTVSVIGIVTDSALTDGTVGTNYSTQLTAVFPDGDIPVWSVTAGALPDGLILDSATGQISGDPTTSGDSNFTIGVTVDGNTCSKDFSLHVSSGVIPPHCLANTGISFDSITGTPTGPFSETRTASVRRMVLVDIDDSKVAFINTDTNSVVNIINLATGYIDGERFGRIAFATSTQNFFFVTADYSAMTVTDIDGNIVGTLSAPAGYNFSKVVWAYSPDADRLYTVQFNGVTGTDHILEFDPNTLTNTRDADTGTAGSNGIFCYPGNVVVYTFNLTNYPISTLVSDKSAAFFFFRGDIDYDPISNRLFFGTNFTADVQAINCSDFSFGTTFTGTVNTGPYQWINYNPVTKSIIALDLNGEILVIDPALDVIACEQQGVSLGTGMAVDYFTGDVYFFNEDDINNPITVWS